ncbi:retinol dehydrogenase 12-like [Amphibalanus amphitrite]|uniref:retinol dehydrogenase 12-like n=1 Tax=Amphibalanus amphitrite TaxID=1232801 RepID=UPI001C92A65F|nr:retinol dehydrogenase 12-like [Amphibalanus amphitrite]XP_043201682.1 retinol dehydrogenase 12-like [Amphibalanus amphitrite]XP_043201683.1 retinol dehydrogenase 12-like [Amphibalanus amphitrite]
MSSLVEKVREDWQEFKREEPVAIWTTYVTVVVLVWLLAPTALYLALTGVLYLAWRRWMIGARCRSVASLEGKTAVVTGANAGIGREVALELSRRGARVIIASRDVSKSRLAAAGIRSETGGEVIVKQLDLASLASVRQFAADIERTEPKVHILVNNAGMLMTERRKTEDGHEMMFQVNFLGPLLLTHLLTKRLEESAPSRIVNVSSMGHWFTDFDLSDLDGERRSFEVWRRYGTSKLCQILWTRELARRLRQRSVSVFSLHPGVVNTEISREQRDRWWYSATLHGILFSYVFRSAKMGAQTAVYCAVEPGLEHESGGYFADCAPGWSSAQAKDDKLAARLCEEAERMLDIKLVSA